VCVDCRVRTFSISTVSARGWSALRTVPRAERTFRRTTQISHPHSRANGEGFECNSGAFPTVCVRREGEIGFLHLSSEFFEMCSRFTCACVCRPASLPVYALWTASAWTASTWTASAASGRHYLASCFAKLLFSVLVCRHVLFLKCTLCIGVNFLFLYLSPRPHGCVCV